MKFFVSLWFEFRWLLVKINMEWRDSFGLSNSVVEWIPIYVGLYYFVCYSCWMHSKISQRWLPSRFSFSTLSLSHTHSEVMRFVATLRLLDLFVVNMLYCYQERTGRYETWVEFFSLFILWHFQWFLLYRTYNLFYVRHMARQQLFLGIFSSGLGQISFIRHVPEAKWSAPCFQFV